MNIINITLRDGQVYQTYLIYFHVTICRFTTLDNECCEIQLELIDTIESKH